MPRDNLAKTVVATMDIAEPEAPRNLLRGYCTENAMAEARGVAKRTLRAERLRGNGPPWIKIGRDIYYSEAGFREWLKAIERRPARGRR
jgi:hypothetical protein